MRLIITLDKEVVDDVEGQALLDQLLNVVKNVPNIRVTARCSVELNTTPPE